MTDHTLTEDCWCNEPPVKHEDDSYGSCVTCREYIHHTEDEWRMVPFPCAVVREQRAAAAERERLRKKAGTSRTAANIGVFLDWLFEAPSDD